MAKEGISGEENIINHYKKICEIVDGDVSAEVISTDFEGMIKEVLKGMVNMEITIEMEGGEHIVSTITHEAAKELGLLPGQKVVAIVKSTDIMIIKNEKENQ